MRIVALLSWYDEDPAYLHAAIESLRHVDALVAVDGAYALFPEARGRSPRQQLAAIIDAATERDLELTVHVPREPWAGNEVAKRAFMFALGLSVATVGVDWFVPLDADERWIKATSHYPKRLASTPEHVATVGLSLKGEAETQAAFPKFFRAREGLTVRGRHHDYYVGEEPVWRVHTGTLDLTRDVEIEHRIREHGRQVAASEYYARRDREDIEGLMLDQ